MKATLIISNDGNLERLSFEAKSFTNIALEVFKALSYGKRLIDGEVICDGIKFRIENYRTHMITFSNPAINTKMSFHEEDYYLGTENNFFNGLMELLTERDDEGDWEEYRDFINKMTENKS